MGGLKFERLERRMWLLSLGICFKMWKRRNVKSRSEVTGGMAAMDIMGNYYGALGGWVLSTGEVEVLLMIGGFKVD